MTPVTSEELHKLYGLKPVTIRAWARQGKLPGAYKTYGLWMFDPIKIKKWWDMNEVKPNIKDIQCQSINATKLIGYGFNGTTRKSADQLEQLLRPKR